MTKTSVEEMDEILNIGAEQEVLNAETPSSLGVKRLTFDLIDEEWVNLIKAINFTAGIKKILEIKNQPIGKTRRICVARPDGTSSIYKNHIIMELITTPNPQVILKAASPEDGNINKFSVPAHTITAIEYE